MNPLLKLIAPLLDKVFDLIPNTNERSRAREDFENKLLEAVNQQTLAQLEVNKQEAAHVSIFVAGWRPAVGWVCAFGLAYSFIFRDIIAWIFQIYFPEMTPPPTLELGELISLLLGMLGLGTLRTFEKVKSVNRDTLKGAVE
jgi:hypothetical protein